MEILSNLSVLTNGAIIIFTMKVLHHYDFTIQLWAFILFQWASWTLQVSSNLFLIHFLSLIILLYSI